MNQPAIIGVPRKGGFWRDFNKNKALLLMLLPGAVVLFLNNYLPMFGVIIAFKDFRFSSGSFFESLFTSEWCGLKNFEFLFRSPDTMNFIRNTILYNLAFIFTCTLISIAFAIMLNEIYSRKLSKFYQSSMFLPYFLSWIVFSYLVYSFLSPDKGFFNKSIFSFLGIKSVYWYSEPKWWPAIILIVNAWKWVGNNCIIYLATIIGIDQEMYEAARIDGASRWKQITNITLPHLMPVIIVMVLIFVGRIINTDLGLFMLVPRNSGMISSATWTIDVFVYNMLMRLGDIGMSSAAAFFQSVVGFVVIIAANFAVKKYNPEAGMF
jgi:putative aldouronate transport system permease protein